MSADSGIVETFHLRRAYGGQVPNIERRITEGAVARSPWSGVGCPWSLLPFHQIQHGGGHAGDAGADRGVGDRKESAGVQRWKCRGAGFF